MHLVSISGANLVVGVDATGIKKVIQISSAFEADLTKITQTELDGFGQELVNDEIDTTCEIKNSDREFAASRFAVGLKSMLGLRPHVG